jgi:hypothetical protein
LQAVDQQDTDHPAESVAVLGQLWPLARQST